MPGSAPNVNHVVLVGQLTRNPDTRTLKDGRTVCDLRLAVNDRQDKPPMFIDVATFGKSAQACAEHLEKGRQVAVTGRLVHREWETKTGEKRAKHQIIGRVAFGSDGRSADNQVADAGEAASDA
jgi:single-strand DNA-binding protein